MTQYSNPNHLHVHPHASSSLSAHLRSGWSILQRRRLLPLAVLALLSALFLLSSSSSPATFNPSSYGLSLPASGNGFARLRGIFVRPSRYTSSAVTSSITSVDHHARRAQNWRSPTPALPLDAPLHARLQDLWDAPIEEPANWVKHNSATCSRERVKQAQNDWLTQEMAGTWHSLNSSDVRGYRKQMIDYLVEADRQAFMDPKKAGSGRGLVFTAGNADTYSRVLLTLKLMKKYYHTALPSEIFSFPGEEPPADLIPQFAELNATLRYVGRSASGLAIAS